MELHYHLLDPTGNVTVLVETPLPAADQPAAAGALLRAEPSAEQAGFLSPGGGDHETALRMAGGEFCGNAAMSAAALYALRHGLQNGTVRVRVSGADDPVPVQIETLPAGVRRGTVEMPRPLAVGRANLPGGGSPWVARFPGIAHVIFPRPMERADAEAAVRGWRAVLEAEALGLMLLDRESGFLTPLVYVPVGDTLYWERSCASGTAAVGAYLAAEAGRPVTRALREPGGTLEVSASPEGAIFLTGTVNYLREGTVTL